MQHQVANSFVVIVFATLGLFIDGQLLNNTEIEILGAANNQTHFSDVLNEILVPRIVGTQSHENVKDFLIGQLQELGMHVDNDVFDDKPPGFQKLTFTNVIGKLNLNADKYLTLACHYDSKYYREHAFVGATDSAVPCAILINVLKTLQPMLQKIRNRTNLSLMVIFFDGEEAFREWSATDSIYGARHLAAKWDAATFQTSDCHLIREIDRIDVLVLLDLIGASGPKFYDFFPETSVLHKRLYSIERSMKSMNLLSTRDYMFMNRNRISGIDDDHRPFLDRNVPVLHLIPSPFPRVWHKPEDDMAHLNLAATEDFIRVFRAFVYEYLRSVPYVEKTNIKC